MSGVCTWGTVISRRLLGTLVWLTVQVPHWPGARPGQFVMLQSAVSRCYLGRPLSVADQEGETVSFLIAPVGPGTGELCKLVVGEQVWIVGPLGKGFDVEAMGWCTERPRRVVLVGGGVGIAPFPLLVRTLAAAVERPDCSVADPASTLNRVQRPQREVLLLAGFRDGQQAQGLLPLRQAAQSLMAKGVAHRLEVATEDGSLGSKERVSELLSRWIGPGDRLAVCGPHAMSEAVAAVCASVAEVEAWYSLETAMACGLGACHGCAVKLKDGSLVRACREGPVFSGELLFGGGKESIPVGSSAALSGGPAGLGCSELPRGPGW